MKTKTQAKIEEMYDGDFSYHVRSQVRQAIILYKYREQIESLYSQFPEINIEVSSSELRLSSPSREELTAWLLAFGGDWEKKVNDWQKDKMDYIQKVPHPVKEYEGDNLDLVACAVEPPPACKIIEEEVEVPARKEMRRRIVCPGAEIPVTTEEGESTTESSVTDPLVQVWKNLNPQ